MKNESKSLSQIYTFLSPSYIKHVHANSLLTKPFCLIHIFKILVSKLYVQMKSDHTLLYLAVFSVHTEV